MPKGQWESVTAINMPFMQTYRRITIPHELPPAISSMGNYLVGTFRDTPILSVIGVAKLMLTAYLITLFEKMGAP
ncbi:Inner membrane amino-acid ABC transporter permease protein YecS [Ruegeria denitrificans]|uniref:Inner membrane amino-acid ABC transporter permease protein YecS n=2 Tax=Ruegeria denitrificans TaxID=1715692 RepID=A0A0P1IK25_9RHOB|nr:Inner membrane amino-acid ABC transporter permease protein YecS [Ruegeria denitrificans]